MPRTGDPEGCRPRQAFHGTFFHFYSNIKIAYVISIGMTREGATGGSPAFSRDAGPKPPIFPHGASATPGHRPNEPWDWAGTIPPGSPRAVRRARGTGRRTCFMARAAVPAAPALLPAFRFAPGNLNQDRVESSNYSK